MTQNSAGAPESKNDLKKEAKRLRNLGGDAIAVGDYRIAGLAFRRAVAVAPDSDAGRAATVELERLKIDPAALYAIAGAGALLVIAWILSVY